MVNASVLDRAPCVYAPPSRHCQLLEELFAVVMNLQSPSSSRDTAVDAIELFPGHVEKFLKILPGKSENGGRQ